MANNAQFPSLESVALPSLYTVRNFEETKDIGVTLALTSSVYALTFLLVNNTVNRERES
jgi:hypothetical protein